MSDQQERAAFEAWATDNGEYPKAVERDSAGNYRLLKVHTDWIAWQAARAALAAQQVPADTAIQQLQEQKDGAYLERNRCVAALARMAIALGQRAGRAKTSIDGWDPAWHGCIYIDLPTGQVSWHYHESQSGLFNDLPEYAGRWDGHDTPTKYERLAAAFPVLAAAPQVPAVPQWRPIETAPMHKAVLLWWRTCLEPAIGRYVSDERGEGWKCDGDQAIPRNQGDCTHWMPLPAAPCKPWQTTPARWA